MEIVFKKILILVALFPLLNFLHEGGHWVGAKAVGLEPKMLLQRVDTGDQSHHSITQKTIYNWSGPTVNYTLMIVGYLFPPTIPLALAMTAHRLGPNVFASVLYLKGVTRFTNDETKQFPEHLRVFVSIFFSILYFLIFIYFLKQWLPEVSLVLRVFLTVLLPAIWIGYLISLDSLDKILL